MAAERGARDVVALVKRERQAGRVPVTSGGWSHLLQVLAAVPDARARRGVRHRLGVILGPAVCAVLAGARPFTAIAEWAADAGVTA